jgi:hypothetical protein
MGYCVLPSYINNKYLETNGITNPSKCISNGGSWVDDSSVNKWTDLSSVQREALRKKNTLSSNTAYEDELARLKSLQEQGKVGADGYPKNKDTGAGFLGSVGDFITGAVDSFNEGYKETDGTSWYTPKSSMTSGTTGPEPDFNFPNFKSNDFGTYNNVPQGPNSMSAINDEERRIQNKRAKFNDKKRSMMWAPHKPSTYFNVPQGPNSMEHTYPVPGFISNEHGTYRNVPQGPNSLVRTPAQSDLAMLQQNPTYTMPNYASKSGAYTVEDLKKLMGNVPQSPPEPAMNTVPNAVPTDDFGNPLATDDFGNYHFETLRDREIARLNDLQFYSGGEDSDVWTQQKRPVGPLNEQGEFQQSDEAVMTKEKLAEWNNEVEGYGNGDYLRFNENWWNPSTWFDGEGHSLFELWSPRNLREGFENWLKNPAKEMPAILPDLAFENADDEKAFAKNMVEHPYTTALTTILLRKPGGATGALVRKMIEKSGLKTIVLGALAWNAAEEQGLNMSNFVKESSSSGKDVLGELLSEGTTETGDGQDSATSSATTGAASSTTPVNVKDPIEALKNLQAGGKLSWQDKLFNPVAGGSGAWDTKFFRLMELIKEMDAPGSWGRSGNAAKRWSAANKDSLAAQAAAAKAGNKKGFVGKMSTEDLGKDINARLSKLPWFTALGRDIGNAYDAEEISNMQDRGVAKFLFYYNDNEETAGKYEESMNAALKELKLGM